MSTATDAQSHAIRRLGKIPVRNLWLLMLYASDLRSLLGTRKVDIEENPEDIADFVAEILCHQVEKRLMRNLSYGYTSRHAVLSRVRGHIDILTTERHSLLEKGKICCRFDELSVDRPRNRYIRAALAQLCRLEIKTELKQRCKKLILNLEALGVSKLKPHNYSSRSERFGLHDVMDQIMVVAADLAFSLALPTEFEGHFHLPTPNTQKLWWLRNLFEKAIAGFYTVTLNKHEWQVSAGTHFYWQKSAQSDLIDAILPIMKTDIIIDHHPSNKRLIIDTKFTSVTTAGRYREHSLRSGYIYQIYAYLRSQEDPENATTTQSIGMLLHPTVDGEVIEMVVIQGHPIWFCTVDLGETAQNIRDRLLYLHEQCFGN